MFSNHYVQHPQENMPSSTSPIGTPTRSNGKSSLSLILPASLDPRRLDPVTAAYGSALLVSLVSFVGIVTLGFLQSKSLKGPVEYLSLCFAGTALVGDALMHLLPEAFGAHSHDPPPPPLGASNSHHGPHHHHGRGHGDAEAHATHHQHDQSDHLFLGLMASLGGLALLVVDSLVSQFHVHEKSFGFANLIVELLHNFVDGIAIGMAWVSGRTLVALLHNFVDGIATGMAWVSSRTRFHKKLSVKKEKVSGSGVSAGKPRLAVRDSNGKMSDSDTSCIVPLRRIPRE